MGGGGGGGQNPEEQEERMRQQLDMKNSILSQVLDQQARARCEYLYKVCRKECVHSFN